MEGALQRPNGIWRNCHKPHGVWNAVFSRSSFRMVTAWKAPAPSMAENTLLWARRLRLDSMLGSG